MAPDEKQGGQDQYCLVFLDSVEYEENFGVWHVPRNTSLNMTENFLGFCFSKLKIKLYAHVTHRSFSS